MKKISLNIEEIEEKVDFSRLGEPALKEDFTVSDDASYIYDYCVSVVANPHKSDKFKKEVNVLMGDVRSLRQKNRNSIMQMDMEIAVSAAVKVFNKHFSTRIGGEVPVEFDKKPINGQKYECDCLVANVLDFETFGELGHPDQKGSDEINYDHNKFLWANTSNKLLVIVAPKAYNYECHLLLDTKKNCIRKSTVCDIIATTELSLNHLFDLGLSLSEVGDLCGEAYRLIKTDFSLHRNFFLHDDEKETLSDDYFLLADLEGKEHYCANGRPRKILA